MMIHLLTVKLYRGPMVHLVRPALLVGGGSNNLILLQWLNKHTPILTLALQEHKWLHRGISGIVKKAAKEAAGAEAILVRTAI